MSYKLVAKKIIWHVRLGTHTPNGRARRPDKDNTFFGEAICKLGILAQKAIAGMNRLGTGPFADVDDSIDAQVRLCTGRGT
jgi:hypothetical protein